MKVAFSLWATPANELVTGRALPRGRPKDQTGQRTTGPISGQILQIFPDGAFVTQVVMLAQQSAQQLALLGSLDHHQLDREQWLQWALKKGLHQERRLGVQGRLSRAAAAPSLASRQLKESAPFQLEQKGACGHVFESARPIAPVPLLGQVKGKSKASPLWVMAD